LLCAGIAFGEEKGGLTPFGPAGITAKGVAGRRFGLFIGLERFTSSGFPPLRYAASDAQRLGQAVEGLDEKKVLTRAEETTRPAILKALRELARRAVRRADTVIVYISSHGALARKPGGPLRRYLITSDAEKDLTAQTALAVGELLRAVERIPARRKAVILASCHSGAGKSVLTDDLAEALRGIKGAFVPPPLEEVSEATAVLSASHFGETAREDDRLRADVYTHFFIEGIARGDLDGDGAVTLTEAHDYARERTYAFTGGQQRPTARLNLVGTDPILLAGVRKRRPKPVLFSYAPSAQGVLVRIDGRPKGELPGTLVVEEGGHEIELRAHNDGPLLYRGRVEVMPGERIELARLIPRLSPPAVELRLGILSGLTAATRRDLVPTAPSVGVEGSLALPWVPWLRLALGLDYAHGNGSAAAPASGSAPYAADLLAMSAALLPRWQRGRWFLEGGPQLGMMWLRRGFSAEGSPADQGLGAILGARLGAGVEVGRLRLAVTLDASALAVSVSAETRSVPLLRALFGVGLTL
jgi:hypothetical protein